MKQRNWITFEVPPELLRQTKALAKKTDRSISWTMREALKHYVETPQELR